MSALLYQNQTDAAQRRVPIFLVAPDGTGYSGSLSGFTIQYRKPGSGSDTTKTLTADGGDGRYYMQLASGDVDTAGVGWVKVVGGAGEILPYVDDLAVLSDPLGVTSLLASMATSLANEGTLATAVAAVDTKAADVQARLPNALVGGNLKTIVEAYASGQAPLQPLVAGRTLQITAAGRAGIDWANVENPTTTVGLSGTTVGTVTALATAANNAIRDAIMVAVVDGTRTVRGVLTRLQAVLMGKATGLLASNPVFYRDDGTSVAISATQDTSAGTRQAGATGNGD